jgi:hypothetical protein
MTGLTTFSDKLNAQQQALRGENSNWFTILPAALQSTATRDSDYQANLGCEGVILEIVVANEAGTCSFTPKIYSVDPAGTNVLIWAAATAITANGTFLYWIHPHADKTATAKNNMTEEGTISLPRDWFLELTYAGTPASDKMDTVAYGTYVR